MLFMASFFSVAWSKADSKNIGPNELEQALLSGITVIDIRREDEWKNTGIINGSHKITFFSASGKYDINDWLKQLQLILKDKEEPFVLICRSGHRTGIVKKILSSTYGYSNVLHLKKGINSWISAGKNTVKP